MNVNPVVTAYGSQIQGALDSQKKAAKSEAARPTASRQESVQLSDTSKNMQSVREAASKAPDVRVELVVEIKRRIKDGSYPLSGNLSEAIDRMIQNKILN